KQNKKTEEVTSNFFITNKMQTHFTREEERKILEEYYSDNITNNRKKLIENQIVRRNLGLVSKMAWQLKAKCSSLDFEELVAAGLLGFTRGLQKFDRRKGYRLST
ncbi:MAG: sigma factor, partial [Flammeovirgaceae bacterium]